VSKLCRLHRYTLFPPPEFIYLQQREQIIPLANLPEAQLTKLIENSYVSINLDYFRIQKVERHGQKSTIGAIIV